MSPFAQAVINAPFQADRTEETKVPRGHKLASVPNGWDELIISTVSSSRVVEPPPHATRSSRGEATAKPQMVKHSRHAGLLLKSLQALQIQRPNQAATGSSRMVVGLSQSQFALPTQQDLERLDTEHIDPLPEFDPAHSPEHHDHCVLVGNCGTETPLLQSDPTAAARESTATGMDRRAYPRRESDGVVTVCRRNSHQRATRTSPNLPWNIHASSLKGALIDVSMTGMALMLSEPLAPDTPLMLQVVARQLDEPLEVAGSVLRCIPLEGGRWRIVCQLESRLTFEQVHLLGKQMFACAMV